LVDFVFNICIELGFGDFCKPDSETLVIPDKQLARGIQYKKIRGLEAEPPVWGVKLLMKQGD